MTMNNLPPSSDYKFLMKAVTIC